MACFDGLHLFLATPCYGGIVTQSYMESVCALMIDASHASLRLSLALLGQDALITRSRNTLLARFLRSDATHILFVDADIGFTPSDVFTLLGRGRDLVGGLYPIRATIWDETAEACLRRGEPLATAALRYVGEPSGPAGPDGLIPARYAGTGFLLVSRVAVERMVAAFPETRCRHAHVAGQDGGEDVHALFDCLIDPETRHYLSEDYAFCARWRTIGGEVWLDPRPSLSHHGMSEFRGAPASRFSGS